MAYFNVLKTNSMLIWGTQQIHVCTEFNINFTWPPSKASNIWQLHSMLLDREIKKKSY